jgi:hypothetical protein
MRKMRTSNTSWTTWLSNCSKRSKSWTKPTRKWKGLRFSILYFWPSYFWRLKIVSIILRKSIEWYKIMWMTWTNNTKGRHFVSIKKRSRPLRTQDLWISSLLVWSSYANKEAALHQVWHLFQNRRQFNQIICNLRAYLDYPVRLVSPYPCKAKSYLTRWWLCWITMLARLHELLA